MVAVNVRYVVERANGNGTVRRYWVRPGYDTVRSGPMRDGLNRPSG